MKPHTVLIVEKDARLARELGEMLAPAGYECRVAGSLADAVRSPGRDEPHCVILSLDMGKGEEGKTAVQAVRATMPHVPVIALSGGDNVADVVEAMRDGATDCLRRPVHPEELLLKLGTRMEGVKAIVDQVADTDITVLVTGESGTGKELVARSLHKKSARSA
jgi:two-component system nitrogen regulation response regulator NtrX